MTYRYDVITLFPEMFGVLTTCGVTRRAHERGIWQLQTWNPRQFASDRYKTIDDRPYGGGPGMVMLAQPLAQAIDAAQHDQRVAGLPAGRVIYLSPQGRRLDHARVVSLLAEPSLVLLCGRYEGVDERLLNTVVDEEISLGDFVLSGGEIAAMALLDALIRQMPDVLNDAASAAQDSFADVTTGGLLDCPHYTRPEVYAGQAVPPVLLSGNHADIARWRRQQALLSTLSKRPDILARAREAGQLTQADERFLALQSSAIKPNP
ncbi:tRNA (guanosine(37)-N1)-methyltransferase TrmD [Parvibium lacunae]|uniref:tRNA (guanine-N(1)-)-methyltransferase n=1 Tax=Parvibium lacunae TaxID=1888893 RepID=A0A368L499_9BURK|nr:tRNA (guanosine(37)-N1)-methyltransferase TrmD [Parvibium lacunae]RCS58408.1 tRNA (guanosine(37)-N1)-methyltransferase TrmD [Parvibium lacunae]